MKKLIVVLLLFTACNIETIKPNNKMQISDACPVQIWVNDELTYNEQFSNLLDHYEFIQEFKPTDKIRFQFTDVPGEDFFLVVKDNCGNFITQFPFSKTNMTTYYLYNKSIVPSTDLLITDKTLKFEITQELDYIITNDLFAADMSGWTLNRFDNDGFFGPFGWVYRPSGGGAATFQFSNTYKACEASQIFAERPAGTYKFSFQTSWDAFDFPSYQIKYNITVCRLGVVVQKILGQAKTTEPSSILSVDTLVAIVGAFDQIKLKVTLVDSIEESSTLIAQPDLSDAINVPFVPGGPDWNVGIAEPYVMVDAPNVYSDYLEITPVIIDFATYGSTKSASITLDVTTDYPIYVAPLFLDGSDTEFGTDAQIISVSGIQTLTFDFDVAADVTKMRLLVYSQSESDGSGPSSQIKVKAPFSISVPSIGPIMALEYFICRSMLIAGRTDAVKVSDDIEDNTLLAYRGYKNTYGLVYDPDDVDDVFYIRIPGLFFGDRPINKQKVIEVPGQVFNSAQSLKIQKLLRIFDGPDYWHLKINSILAHATTGFVQINAVDWTVQENYEDDGDRPESYPMRAAKTWLTRKRYSKRVFT